MFVTFPEVTSASPEEQAQEPNRVFPENRWIFWYLALLLICMAAFFLTALISEGIFERIPHVEDEAA